jgi:hypothetical protein
MMPARYQNKVACYETVYLLSNLPFEELYKNLDLETRRAFRRRFTQIKNMEEVM